MAKLAFPKLGKAYKAQQKARAKARKKIKKTSNQGFREIFRAR